MFLVDQMPSASIPYLIIISMINPLLFSLTLFLILPFSKHIYWILGILLMGIIDLWESYFHLISGQHLQINIMAVLNLFPYLLLTVGIIEMEKFKVGRNQY